MKKTEPVLQTRAERLTRAFYEWELRGRGWQVWDLPVALEPPFVPFALDAALLQVPDDGRRPGPMEQIGRKLRSFVAGDVGSDGSTTDDAEEPLPTPYLAEGPRVEIQVACPHDLIVTREVAERFLVSLPPSTEPFAFEIVGQHGRVGLQFCTSTENASVLWTQIASYFPGVVLTRTEDSLTRAWAVPGEALCVDYGLSQEFMRPIRLFNRFEPDPLTGVFAALSDLNPGEAGFVQALFSRAEAPWAAEAQRAVSDGRGRSFFADSPDMPKLAAEKFSSPAFACVLRCGVKAADRGRAKEVARALGGGLAPFEDTRSNALFPLNNDGYPDPLHELDVLDRVSHRTGMVLTSSELAGLVHPPHASVQIEVLERRVRKTRAAPRSLDGELVLGINQHAGKQRPVALSADHRTRHVYVVGASGTGKSTLLLRMIVQDIEAGRGVGVLDPHGDLIDEVLWRIPEERIQDVVLMNPGDADYPVGFNVLSAHSELERTLLSSDLVAAFRKLSTSWGDQMNAVLANGILAFLESERGGTLADLRRFLVEPGYRKEFLSTVRDPEVTYYWEREFPLLSGKPQAPILTRLDAFLRPRVIRNMVGQKENRLDLGAVMNTGKIFLGKLAQGAIGEENAYLLGAFLVAKLQQTALSRQEMKAEERRPFYLYIDEFHNFITPSVASILAGARKYRMGLTLAHQDLKQLSARDPEVLNSVLTNPGTRVCFRVGEQDAKALSEGFRHFDRSDLQGLGTGQAIARVGQADHDFSLDTSVLHPVDEDTAQRRTQAVIEHSRSAYAIHRSGVEPQGRGDREATPPQVPVPVAGTPEARGTIPDQPQKPATTQRVIHRPVIPPSPGRGGQQHKYLQELIKRWADANEWRAGIEERILDGLGNVDVALRKGERTVACEVSVTTDVAHEIGNVQKCLAAGFDRVVLVATRKTTLRKAAKALDMEIMAPDRARVVVATPEELFSLLEGMDAELASSEATVKGYKVKVRYRSVGEEEKQARRQVVSQVIARALGRLGTEDKETE